jgi:aminoglycoside phosphotransferase (APT) family kinase protein
VPSLHPDELPIDLTLVRRLVDRQLPEYADLGLVPIRESGSSNALFRLGSDRLVRLPRQPGGGASIDKESVWLPSVASRVAVEVPTVLRIGEPDLGYPERWAVTTWLRGARPAVRRGDGRASRTSGLARDLAQFLTELRAMELPHRGEDDETLDWYRGRPLFELDADFRETADECRRLPIGLDVDAALRVWDRAVDASRGVGSAHTWFHGDLLAENLLVDEAGALSAVIDFGGLAVGDPTVDLVVAWEALDDDGRRTFRRSLDVDDRTWTVSRGWALLIALITFPYYGTTMPARCADRRAMAEAAIRGG